jgi:hypothetical protein
MSLLRVIALKQPLARAGSGTERPLRSTEATCSFQNFDRFSCEWGACSSMRSTSGPVNLRVFYKIRTDEKHFIDRTLFCDELAISRL